MDSLIRTRELTLNDVDVCAEWVDEHPLFRLYGLTPARLAASLTAALERREGLLMAEDASTYPDPTPVGLAWYLSGGTFYHSAYLRLLLVSRRATGGGVGRQLLDAVEKKVFEHAGDLFALVNVDNHAAQRFYERLGYRRVGELPDYVGPGLNEYIYRKQRHQRGERGDTDPARSSDGDEPR